MKSLKPWAYGPFELILHAEMHYRDGEDFDRRVAMIGYDNAIEVAITTYLELHPIQRGYREYAKADVEKWLQNYHTKIDFLEAECATRGVEMESGKDEIIWYHEVRNGQYHGGSAVVPQARELDGVRSVALHVFAILFNEQDVAEIIDERYEEIVVKNVPQRTDGHDRLIDGRFGVVELVGQDLYTSELLYAWDPVAYSDIAGGLASDKTELTEEDE